MTKRQRVLQAVNHFRPLLGLNSWDIEVRFGPLDDTEGDPAAGCEANARYRFAVLQFNLNKFSDHDVELMVVHELLHCYTARQNELIEWLWARLNEETHEQTTVDLERMPVFHEHIRKLQRRALTRPRKGR